MHNFHLFGLSIDESILYRRGEGVSWNLIRIWRGGLIKKAKTRECPNFYGSAMNHLELRIWYNGWLVAGCHKFQYKQLLFTEHIGLRTKARQLNGPTRGE